MLMSIGCEDGLQLTIQDHLQVVCQLREIRGNCHHSQLSILETETPAFPHQTGVVFDTPPPNRPGY